MKKRYSSRTQNEHPIEIPMISSDEASSFESIDSTNNVSSRSSSLASHQTTIFLYLGRLLSQRDYSESDLRTKLKRKFPDISMEVFQLAIERCQELGLQNDLRFASSFVRQRMKNKTIDFLLRQVQQKHGISNHLAQSIKETLFDEGLLSEETQSSTIEHLWERKFNSLIPTDEKSKQKQFRFFISRGFSYDDISRLWKKNK